MNLLDIGIYISQFLQQEHLFLKLEVLIIRQLGLCKKNPFLSSVIKFKNWEKNITGGEPELKTSGSSHWNNNKNVSGQKKKSFPPEINSFPSFCFFSKLFYKLHFETKYFKIKMVIFCFESIKINIFFCISHVFA